MRRRSERKKSTDVSSPAPVASRRTNRRRKSHSVSEDDKNVDQNIEVNEKHTSDMEDQNSGGEKERDSSEERVESRRSRRSSRSKRTPVREQQQQRTSPAKRRNRRDTTSDNNIPVIQEEDTSVTNDDFVTRIIEGSDYKGNQEVVKEKIVESEELRPQSISEVNKSDVGYTENKETPLTSPPKKERNYDKVQKEKGFISPRAEHQKAISQDDEESRSSVRTDKEIASNEDPDDKDDQDEVKLHTRDNSPRSRSNSSERKQPKLPCQVAQEEEAAEDGEVIEKTEKKTDEPNINCKVEDSPKKDRRSKLEEVNHNQDGKTNESSNTTAAADTGRDSSRTAATIKTTTQVRKRRWITKKISECNKEPILAISTDSLKTLIADVHPVPLSDVQLESSSDIEDVTSEREEGEQSPTPEPERRRGSIEKVEITLKRQQSKESIRHTQVVAGVGTATGPYIQRLPSPARNQASCVLYITNLVRPFTVLQLKGLLARTGKIVEDGFWIDRIKSKCFVEYETEDEAIETRHALHGVRWPASNPKCLNVDFGKKSDMQKAIESTKEEAPKFGHETNKDNLLVGSGWGREHHDEDKRGPRPVREWDVGKKENLDRDLKAIKDMERRRGRSRERERDNSRTRDNDRSERDKNERERNERDRERRRRDRENRSASLSPARKQKKKDDPPLRLLDDLFRKTKGTPCIYWLPLTPEQIAEKEAFRVKRLEEQKQRLKQREMEREKERERERERIRQNERDRDRDRDHRRPRSSDRRRSRSRDRRRY